MLPPKRIATLLPGQPDFYVLPPNSLDGCTSASFCGLSWALTVPSPGEQNYCRGENFRLRLSVLERSLATQQPPEWSSTEASPRSGMQDEPQNEVLPVYVEDMDVDLGRGSVDRGRVSHQCCSQVTELKQTIESLNGQIDGMMKELHQIREMFKEKNNYFKEAFQLTGENQRKMYGLFKSREDLEVVKKNLRHVSVDGKTLSHRQIAAMTSFPWLAYHRDPTKPNADFLRCNLCNRGTGTEVYSPTQDHANCEVSSRSDTGALRTNALGKGPVVCLHRYAGRDPSRRSGIYVLLNRVRAHESTIEHDANFQEYIGVAKEVESRVPFTTEGLDDKPYAFMMKRMVALSSDGASVMTGSSGGVHKKLQDLIFQETLDSGHARQSFLLSVCAAHKLDLAVMGQKGAAFKLTQTLVSELHSLFTSTRGRIAYSVAAKDMGFHNLKMDALYTVRWSASIQTLSKILRVYPALIEASERLARDSSISSTMRERAETANFVLNDGRIFIVLHHVNATLSYLARLSEALQDEEALLQFCSLPGARDPFFEFYNSIAEAVRALDQWPANLRQDKNSIRLYQTLLNNGEALRIPDLVLQDTSQRTECSTVEPKNLVRQWMNPVPGLELKSHLPSSTERQGSLMKEVKDAIAQVTPALQPVFFPTAYNT
ncbi:hypothetical protein OSTOST_04219 [Ostertagia ostertagi]